MRFTDLPLNPSPRTLRQFAAVWLVFFGSLALYWGWWRESTTVGLVLGLLAVTLGPLGLAWPPALRPIFVGWMVLVFPISWVLSHVLLGLVYYGLFTPLALVFRVKGRDVLMRQRRPTTESYWLPKPAVTDPRQYYRQF